MAIDYISESIDLFRAVFSLTRADKVFKRTQQSRVQFGRALLRSVSPQHPDDLL